MSNDTQFWNLTDKATRAWAQYGEQAVLVTGGLLGLLLTLAVWRFTRSTRKDRWIDRIAAVLVLAWTSEGMWEVTTEKLKFPIPFAIATFFVVEAMLMSSAMRATQHRDATGVPGPSGTFVWVLASVFGFVVALNAGSKVEFALRVALPIAAVGLWWNGLTAERATDTEEMRAERRRRAEARDATWTVTPRSLLVRWGLMKPGKTTTTEAQREHQIRRMVAAADRARTASRLRSFALWRLRRMTRTADAAMIAEVAVRVGRARRAEELMVDRTTLEATSETTPETMGRTIEQPMVQTASETTVETTGQTTAGATRRTTGRGGSKSRRRTRDQLRVQLEDKVADLVADGGEIQVKPLADELRANRKTVRELLDEMGIRPMVRKAAGE